MSTRATRGSTASTSSSASNKREITSFFQPKSKRSRVETTLTEDTAETNTTASSVSSPLEPSQLSTSEETKEIPLVPPLEDNNTSELIPAPQPAPAALSSSGDAVIPLFDLGSWSDLLKDEFQKSYFKSLMRFVDQEYKTATVYPPKEQLFTAFLTCDLSQLKVVIIGQDPYHGPNQAHGLAFSVMEGNSPPPSLRNIFKEAKVC